MHYQYIIYALSVHNMQCTLHSAMKKLVCKNSKL